jgi:hypothetical protein
MVFDCDAYESIRDRHRPLLFDQGGNGDWPVIFLMLGAVCMAAFMNQNDVRRLSSFT